MSKPRALFLAHGDHMTIPNNPRDAWDDLLRVQAGLDVTVDEDYTNLTADRLATFDLIINYSGYKSRIEPNEAQLRALLAAVEGGRPYLPVHGAALMFRNQVYYRQPLGHLLSNPDPNDLLDPVQVRFLEMLQNAFLTWPKRPKPNSLLGQTQLDYLEMNGSAFITHGPIEPFTVRIVDHDHPITRGISDFETVDELYQLGGDRSKMHVLAESAGQPLVYTSHWGKAKIAYNALGHSHDAVRNPGFQRLVLQAIAWALSGP